MVTIFKIVKMLARSCFLITLTKCLKGHKSPGLLFGVKNKKWPTQSVTQSLSQRQGHLLSCLEISEYWGGMFLIFKTIWKVSRWSGKSGNMVCWLQSVCWCIVRKKRDPGIHDPIHFTEKLGKILRRLGLLKNPEKIRWDQKKGVTILVQKFAKILQNFGNWEKYAQSGKILNNRKNTLKIRKIPMRTKKGPHLILVQKFGKILRKNNETPKNSKKYTKTRKNTSDNSKKRTSLYFGGRIRKNTLDKSGKKTRKNTSFWILEAKSPFPTMPWRQGAHPARQINMFFFVRQM